MMPKIRFIAYSVTTLLLCEYLTLPVHCALVPSRFIPSSKTVADGFASTSELETSSVISKEFGRKGTGVFIPTTQRADIADSKQLADEVKLNSHPDINKKPTAQGTGAFITHHPYKNLRTYKIHQKPMPLRTVNGRFIPQPDPKPQSTTNFAPKKFPTVGSNGLRSASQTQEPRRMFNNVPELPESSSRTTNNIHSQTQNPTNPEQYLPSSLLAEINA